MEGLRHHQVMVFEWPLQPLAINHYYIKVKRPIKGERMCFWSLSLESIVRGRNLEERLDFMRERKSCTVEKQGDHC